MSIEKNVYIYKLEVKLNNDYDPITYLGQTLSIEKRLKEHFNGKRTSAKILRSLKKIAKSITKINYDLKQIFVIKIKIKITGKQEQLNQSFIDSVRTDFESIIFDFTANTKNDFGAYNVENIFKNTKIDKNELLNKICELSSQKVNHYNNFKNPLQKIYKRISEVSDTRVTFENILKEIETKINRCSGPIEKLDVICKELNDISNIKFQVE